MLLEPLDMALGSYLLETPLWRPFSEWLPSEDVYFDDDSESMLDPQLRTPATSPLADSPGPWIKPELLPVPKSKPRQHRLATHKGKGKKRGPKTGKGPRYIRGEAVAIEYPAFAKGSHGLFTVINFRKQNAWSRRSVI